MVSEANLAFLRGRGGAYIVGTPKSMLRQFEQYLTNMESYLQKMQQSATNGRLKDLALAQRRLGRVHQRYWRAAGAFDVKITSITSSTGKVKLAVDYTRNQHWNEWAKIKSGDVVLPARGRGGQPDRRIRLRCVVTPDPAQKVLLDRLGLTLPQRLRRIDEIVQM